MRQIVYISTICRDAVIDVADILAVSQRNNARCQITGLLFFDGKRFLQALEGDDQAIVETMARIGRDGRHRSIVNLSDRTITSREFGAWSMTHRSFDAADHGEIARIRTLAAQATPTVLATFESFAQIRRAA